MAGGIGRRSNENGRVNTMMAARRMGGSNKKDGRNTTSGGKKKRWLREVSNGARTGRS